jgi:hypothetical protein
VIDETGLDSTTMVDALPLLVVDAANVVGSVPDGWWHDRKGATERLRDALVAVASGHGPSRLPPALRTGPVEVVLVVEGAARSVKSIEHVRVVDAPGSGDDRIVDLVRDAGAARTCMVATADRGLMGRVQALGASVIGARTIHPRG